MPKIQGLIDIRQIETFEHLLEYLLTVKTPILHTLRENFNSNERVWGLEFISTNRVTAILSDSNINRFHERQFRLPCKIHPQCIAAEQQLAVAAAGFFQTYYYSGLTNTYEMYIPRVVTHVPTNKDGFILIGTKRNPTSDDPLAIMAWDELHVAQLHFAGYKLDPQVSVGVI